MLIVLSKEDVKQVGEGAGGVDEKGTKTGRE